MTFEQHQAKMRAPAVLAVTMLVAVTLAGCTVLPRPIQQDLAGTQPTSEAWQHCLDEGDHRIPKDHHGPDQGPLDAPFFVGAWLGTWPSGSNCTLEEFESEVQMRLDIVDLFIDWRTPAQNLSWALKHLAEHDSVAMVTWEPHGYTTGDILNGSKMLHMRDGTRMSIADYIPAFAAGICEVAQATDHPVLLRPMHEMNGGWYSWGVSHMRDGNLTNSNEAYKEAWVLIHDAFRSRCGELVQFVWAINHFSQGEGASFMGAYPGEQYVDIVGIDGYDWGSAASWGPKSFKELFHAPYCAVTEQTSHPIIIAETAAAEHGGGKVEWIRQSFQAIREGGYSEVVGMVWFNQAKNEVEAGGRVDWRVQSSPEALDAFQDGVRSLQEQGRDGDAADPCRG